MFDLFTFNQFMQFIVISIDAIGFWLAFLVYRNNPKGKINRLFVLMTVLMFFWVDFAWLSRAIYPNNPSLSLFIVRIAWLVTPLFFASLYFFSIELIQEKKKYRFLSKIIVASAIIFALFTLFTDLTLEGIKYTDGVFSFIYGKAILPFLLLIFFMVIANLYPLFQKYFQLEKKAKTKIKFYLIGIFIFYLANIIFNIFLPMVLGISRYYYIADYSIIFLLIFTFFAIIKYKFLDIKIIFTETLVAIISILLLIDFFGSMALFEYVWKGILLLGFLIAGYLLIASALKEIQLREKLQKTYDAVKQLNETLEQKVQERTKELKESKEIAEKRAAELEKWYNLTVGRELKMVELKKKIKELENKIGEE